MTIQSIYECFLRDAFGFGMKGKMLDRGDDPAGLANTDSFNERSIDAVKAGTGYAMEIMSNAVINYQAIQLSDEEITRLEDFTRKVIRTTNLKEIGDQITEFRNNVINKYFDRDEGRISLKKNGATH